MTTATMRIAAASHPSEQDSAEACADCARARDCRACFEELVRRFQVPLLHFLTRRLRSRDDAEDLVQETFLLAYRNLARYDSNWRFSTWLFTIAHRLALSASRKQKRRGEPVMLAVDKCTDPLLIAQDKEMRSTVWDVAQRILRPDAFTALWLHHVEQMPADEIAPVIGRNINAVRILLHRARTRLAKEFGHRS